MAEIESLLAAFQAKEAEGVRQVGEADPKFIPSTEPLNPITLIPEKPINLVPMNTEHPSTGSYIVKPGDSYWTIARQIYGDSEQWKLLYETNKHIMPNPDNPHLLFPGMALDIPPLSTPASVASYELRGVSVQIKEKELEPAVSKPVSGASLPVPGPAIPGILGTVPAMQEYTVKTGDSYWSIADRFYGDVQLWRIVYEANKDRMINPDNPHLIFPGMMLTIPHVFSGQSISRTGTYVPNTPVSRGFHDFPR